MNGLECGCERGDGCTMATVCQISTAVEDLADEIKDKDIIIEAAKELCPKAGYHLNDAHWVAYDKLHALLYD